MLKLAFIETSAINYCYDNNVGGVELNTILNNNGYSPVMGVSTVYELARCFTTNCVEEAKLLFNIVRALAPMYGCSINQLCEMELRKLANGVSVDPFIKTATLKLLEKRIIDYCVGVFDDEHKKFVDGRQVFWDETRSKFWSGTTQPLLKKTYPAFDDYLKYVLESLENRKEFRDIFKQYLFAVYRIDLTDFKMQELIRNLGKYPALRGLLYSQIYLGFQTEYNNRTPKEDRFTDSIQIIEASYCSAFVSFDLELVPRELDDKKFKLTTVLNSSIQQINVKRLIYD